MPQKRIEVFLDFISDRSGGLRSFRTDFSEAKGISEKFKVAAGGAMDYAKSHAVQLAAVGGAALVAFGVKALEAFEDTARAAKTGADATGLNVEQMSRWIAAADDAGLSAEAITKSFVAIIKALDKDKWDQYHISVTDAGGAFKSTNELMLEAFDVISKIPEGTSRAKAELDLFGRSYKELAPFVGKSREEIEKQLAAVEKGQVITEAESAKAEKMRMAQDELADALGEVQLAIGGVLAEGAPLLSLLADVTGAVAGLVDKLQESADGWAKALHVPDVHLGTDDWSDFRIGEDVQASIVDTIVLVNRLAGAADGQAPKVQRSALAIKDAAIEAANYKWQQGGGARAAEDAAQAAQEDADAKDAEARAAADAAESIREQTQVIKDQFSYLRGLVDAGYAYQTALQDTKEALDEYNTVQADGKSTDDDRIDSLNKTRDRVIATSEAFVKAKGASLDSKEGIDLQIQALYGLASTLGPNDPLRTQLVDYINVLAGIKEQISTNVVVTGIPAATAGLQEILDMISQINKAGGLKLPTSGSGGLANAPGNSRTPTGTPFAAGTQANAGRGGAGQGVSAGGVVWQNGEWVQQEEAAADQSAEDQLAAQDRLMSNKLALNQISLADYLKYLEAQQQAEADAGRESSDRRVQLVNEAKQIRVQQAEEEQQARDDAVAAEDEKQKWLYDHQLISADQYKAYLRQRYGSDAEYTTGWYALQNGIKKVNDEVAAAFEAAEKRKQDAIDATNAKINSSASAQADLEVAAQKQLAAEERLKLLQIAAQNPGEAGEAARAQLGQAEQDLAAATLAGAQARAKASGLEPGSAAYNAQVQSDVAAFIAQHPNLGGGFASDLQQLVKAIPSANDYATAMTQVLVPALVQALQAMQLTISSVGVQAITAAQKTSLAGNT